MSKVKSLAARHCSWQLFLENALLKAEEIQKGGRRRGWGISHRLRGWETLYPHTYDCQLYFPLLICFDEFDSADGRLYTVRTTKELHTLQAQLESIKSKIEERTQCLKAIELEQSKEEAKLEELKP